MLESSLEGTSLNLCGPNANFGLVDFPLSPETEKTALYPAMAVQWQLNKVSYFNPTQAPSGKHFRGVKYKQNTKSPYVTQAPLLHQRSHRENRIISKNF